MIIPGWRSASATQTSAPGSMVALIEHSFAFYRTSAITIGRAFTSNAWSCTHNRPLVLDTSAWNRRRSLPLIQITAVAQA
jgi:hypothetical protein